MESLDPQCTPLKHRYDSCFNLWFEGYLQPALDGRAAPGPSVASTSSSMPAVQNPAASPPPPRDGMEDVETSNQAVRRTLITNWSQAFRSRDRPLPLAESEQALKDTEVESPAAQSIRSHAARSVDPRGKTRAQIKAEEYELACGHHWREYQGCLTAAVAKNSSLTTLLDQARDEHPLTGQDGLGGTAWDPDHRQ